jgi:hypothetical protein
MVVELTGSYRSKQGVMTAGSWSLDGASTPVFSFSNLMGFAPNLMES